MCSKIVYNCPTTHLKPTLFYELVRLLYKCQRLRLSCFLSDTDYRMIIKSSFYACIIANHNIDSTKLFWFSFKLETIHFALQFYLLLWYKDTSIIMPKVITKSKDDKGRIDRLSKCYNCTEANIPTKVVNPGMKWLWSIKSSL